MSRYRPRHSNSVAMMLPWNYLNGMAPSHIYTYWNYLYAREVRSKILEDRVKK
jgi:hypothetical protein